MELLYSPDIIDWPHVVKVIEKAEKFREKIKEARRREFKKKFLKIDKS